MEEKACLNCGLPVGQGRKDKKYCTDACKTEYNNRLKEQKQEVIIIPHYIAEINKIILNNWKVLHDCLGKQGYCKMRVRDLIGRGYNFKYHTAERVNDQDDKVYHFCYDVGYKVVADGEKVILVQNDHMVRLSGPAHV
jgi:hypothetical protein